MTALPLPVLADRYRLDGAIGSGGMCDVWEATDLMLDQRVAVKEVRISAAMSAAEADVLRERAMREARAAARLRSHPAIVTVHDVVMHEGRPWIVMEFVDGRSLDRIIAEDGPLPPRQVAAIGLAVIDALATAHSVGVMHRDVKPANVMLCRDGRALLNDFGIASMAGDPTLTNTGIVMGSLGFVAPERLDGSAAEPPSDLWSLGATLYNAVEGVMPHQRTEPLAQLVAALNHDPDPPRRAGPLTPILTGLLQRNPAHRVSAGRARAMLAAVAGGRAETAALPTRPSRTKTYRVLPGLRTGTRTRLLRPVLAAGATLTLLAVAGAVVTQQWRADSAGPARVAPAANATSPRPAAPPPAAGLFTANPNPCTLVSDDTASRILKRPMHGVLQTRQMCMWATPRADSYVSLTYFRSADIAAATANFGVLAQQLRDEPRRNPRARVRDTTTAGDTTVACEIPDDGPVQQARLTFRLRNLVVQVNVLSDQRGYQPADTFTAAVLKSLPPA